MLYMMLATLARKMKQRVFCQQGQEQSSTFKLLWHNAYCKASVSGHIVILCGWSIQTRRRRICFKHMTHRRAIVQAARWDRKQDGGRDPWRVACALSLNRKEKALLSSLARRPAMPWARTPSVSGERRLWQQMASARHGIIDHERRQSVLCKQQRGEKPHHSP